MKNYAYFTYEKGVWNTKETLTNEDIVTIMVENKIPLETKTDTHFSYCNTNYAILALIIEKITRLKYPEMSLKTLKKKIMNFLNCNIRNDFFYFSKKFNYLF